MTVRLTVVQNSPDVPADRLAGWLADAALTVVRLDEGAPVPALDEIGDGLVVLGGHANAYDDAGSPWLPALRSLLADASRAGVPTLAICLGAQLLAVARGGRVQVAAPPGIEAGVVDVFWRPEACDDALVGPIAGPLGKRGRSAVPTMHSDAVVELPAGAVWLASSNQYPYQAFRVGSAWGIQFHPEVGADVFRGWARTHDELDVEALMADFDEHDDATAALGETLAAAFLARVHEAASVPA